MITQALEVYDTAVQVAVVVYPVMVAGVIAAAVLRDMRRTAPARGRHCRR